MAYLPRSVWLIVACCAFALGACGTSSPDVVIAKADAMIANGQWADANVKLKKLAQDFPGNAAARERLARIAIANGDYAAAAEEIARVDRAALQNSSALPTLLEIDLSARRYSEVIQQLDSFGGQLSDAQLLWFRGRAQNGLAQKSAALESFRQAVAAEPSWAEPAVSLADAYVATGDLPRAESVISNYLKLYPADPDARVALGRILVARGEQAAAGESFAKATAEAPASWSPSRRWSAKYQQADASLMRNDLVAAKLVLTEMQKAVPGIAATRLLGARIALLERRYDDGIEELQRLSQASSNNAIELLLAQAQLTAGRREQGAETLERILARTPDSLPAARVLAKVYLEQNRADQAITLLQRIPAASGDPESVTLIGAARLQLGQPEEARESLEAAVAANPSNNLAKLQLAAIRLALGDTQGARDALDDIPATQSSAQQVRLRLLTLVAQRDMDQLGAYVDSLIAKSPQDFVSLDVAIDVLAAAGRDDIAQRVAAQLLAADTDRPGTLRRVALLAARRQDWATAEQSASKAIAADDTDVNSHLTLAQVVAARGDDGRAIKIVENIRRKQPAAIEPQLLRASAYMRANDLAAAQRTIGELVAAAPKDGVAAAAAGSLMWAAGHAGHAAQQFAVAVEQAPTAENLLSLSRALAGAGDIKGGVQAATRALAARPDWQAAVATLASLEVASGQVEGGVARAAKFAARFPKDVSAQRLHGEMLLAGRRAAESSVVLDRAYKMSASSSLAVARYRARTIAGISRPEAPLLEWLAVKPDDLAVRALLAEAYLRAGNRPQAIGEYESLLARSSNNVLTLNNLAWLYADSNIAKAEALARRALAVTPEAAPVLDTLGWILFKRNKTAEALLHLEKAAINAANDASIQYHYGAALAKSGNTTKARGVLERALSGAVEFEGRRDAAQLLKELSK